MNSIMHFHENTLPDIRIEKFCLFQKKIHENTKTIYVGGKKVSHLYTGRKISELFDYYEILNTNRLIRLGIPAIFNFYKKRFYKIYQNYLPDIVHAHNIFAAKVCHDLNIPFIYDDHEFWTFQAIARIKRPKQLFDKNQITDRLFLRNMKKWEKEVVYSAKAIIGVSPTQVKDLVKMYKIDEDKCFTVSNFPSQEEITKINELEIDKSDDKLNSILVSKPGGIFFDRSTLKLIETYKKHNLNLTLLGQNNHLKIPDFVNYKGFVPHREFLKELVNHHVGLMQFAKNDLPIYYKYMSPNRLFYYAHFGLIPVIKDQMIYLKDLFEGMALIVKNESEIGNRIKNLQSNMDQVLFQNQKITKLARKKMIFENQVDEIQQAYKLAEDN